MATTATIKADMPIVSRSAATALAGRCCTTTLEGGDSKSAPSFAPASVGDGAPI